MSASPFPTDLQLKEPVCVFCGSSPGNYPIYARAATSVGQALAKASIPVVYGGGRRGIMGVVSQSTLQAGGYVHGVLPRALLSRAAEVTSVPGEPSGSQSIPEDQALSKEGTGIDLLEVNEDGRLTMEVVGSMHERKLKMAQLSKGGFIVLPGGYGTYEEMMEMITWNQLGIHRLPILVLNIGGFFTPVKALLANAVEAGFIKAENLSLVQIIDLPGDGANQDESRAEEWGAATIKGLKEWTFEDEAGYGLDWNGTVGKHNGIEEKASVQRSPLSLFTTLRYTSPSPTTPSLPVRKEHIPLLDRHIGRLREAHEHFSKSTEGWGTWPGNGAVWDALREKLEETERREQGDWRVRLLLHPGAKVEVQVVPAPAGAGPFKICPDKQRPEQRRPLIFDPETYKPDAEDDDERDLRLYKTTERGMYDMAGARGSQLHPHIDHPEVLLHTATHLLETITSNIAIYLPAGTGHPEWVTPRIDKRDQPFLDGVMRRYLLAEGVIREGDVTGKDWEQVKRDGGRVIGFNGLRGVWEAEPY